MKVRGSWMCAAAVVGAAVLSGCSTPTAVTKYDVAYNLQEKADKTQDVQMKAKDYNDAIVKYNEFIMQNQMVYKNLVPYAMYKIALCYWKLGMKPEAMTAYKEVLDKYPGSKPAEWSRAEMTELEGLDLKPLPKPMPQTMPMKSAPAK